MFPIPVKKCGHDFLESSYSLAPQRQYPTQEFAVEINITFISVSKGFIP